MNDCHQSVAEWIDFGGVQDQTFCRRVLCWPCHSSIAFCAALSNCDCCGIMKVLCCCPCRTCCGWYATESEQQQAAKTLDDEPEEIPYTRVFEMEKKKREKMKASGQ